MKEHSSSYPLSSIEALSGRELILFNDDFNTFDFVIETLVEVCEHEPEQAEQCAIIAHFRGKCCIKSGDQNLLDPMHKEMNSRGLTTRVE